MAEWSEVDFSRDLSPVRDRDGSGILEFRLPSAFEEERRKEFKTYENYVAAIAFLADQQGLLEDIASSERFSRIHRRPDVDAVSLGRLLRLAWATELNLVSTIQLAGAALAGHNALHQAYYAPYTGIRAYFLGSGLEVPQSHQAHLRALADTISQRLDLFPLPWRVLAKGEPEAGLEVFGVGEEVAAADVSNLAHFEPENALALLVKALKTTRERQMKELVSQWRSQHGKKRIPAAERSAIAERLPPTSVFHFLYRMRIKSDYQDADTFISGLVTEPEADAFCRNLCAVTYHALAALELLTAKYVGKALFREAVESFAEADRQGISDTTVQRRWQTISELF